MTTPCGYSFPDISRADRRRAAASERTAPAFERIAPGVPGSACRRRPPGSTAGDRTGWAPGAPLPDVEQAAYCRGFADGEKNGYEQGERAGAAAAMQPLEQVLQSLRQVLAGLEALHRRDARAFEKDLVQLALAVARKVVGREVAAAPDVVVDMLREGLARLEHPGALTIRMNPEDLKRLADVQTQLLEGRVDSGRVRFEADAGVSPGGCYIESEAGDVDARVEQRFRTVAEALEAEHRRDAGPRGPGG